MEHIISADKGGSAGAHIKDSDTTTFVADVLDASKQVPVIVDFWAPWCEPCKQLTPALEKLVNAAGGTVRLVKINVDENQEIAARMRIQSIPAVFAFKDGQAVDGFMGALPESQLKQFISRLTGGAATAEVEAMLEDAKEKFAKDDFASAAQQFGEILQRDRENADAIAGLARCQLAADNLEGARVALELAPPALQNHAEIASARAALELAENPVDEDEIQVLTAKIQADPNDHEARLGLAVALNGVGEREQALDHLMAIIEADREWNDQAARRQLVQLFEAWGPTDELTVSGRRRLSSVLFS